MARTLGGYTFKCKICGESHLCESPEKINQILHEKGQVVIPCVSDKTIKGLYFPAELSYWSGFYWDAMLTVVNLE